jgi:hypothetical protein
VLRTQLKETLRASGLVEDLSIAVTSHTFELTAKLARLLCLPRGHGILVGGPGQGRLLTRYITHLMNTKMLVIDGLKPSGDIARVSDSAFTPPEHDWRDTLRSAVCATLGVPMPNVNIRRQAASLTPADEGVVLFVDHAQELEPQALKALSSVVATGDASFLFSAVELQRIVQSLLQRPQEFEGPMIGRADDGSTPGMQTTNLSATQTQSLAVTGDYSPRGGRTSPSTGSGSPARARTTTRGKEPWQTTLNDATTRKAALAASTRGTSGHYDIVGGEQVRVEAVWRQATNLVRKKLRIFIYMDEHLARPSEDSHEYHQNVQREAELVMATQKAQFLSEFLELYPPLRQYCTTIWFRRWDIHDVDQVGAYALSRRSYQAAF